MFGFFDSAPEFTESNVSVIDRHCANTNGYCYVPATTLNEMQYKGKRFKVNTQFGEDMLYFVKNGTMP